MNQWKGLLKKEFKLGLKGVLIGLILLMTGIFITFLFSYDKYPMSMFAPAWLFLMFHVFYLSIYIFSSLRSESGRLHLWLHNPQPARNLLLAKILNGVLGLIISFTINSLFVYYTASKGVLNFKFGIEPLLIAIPFLGYSVYMAIWVMFLWVLYQVLKGKIATFSWLIIIIIAIGSAWLLDLFRGSKIYAFLTNWGTINIKGFTEYLTSTTRTENFDMGIVEYSNIQFGEITFYFLIILILFFLSSWLLDKKVEV